MGVAVAELRVVQDSARLRGDSRKVRADPFDLSSVEPLLGITKDHLHVKQDSAKQFVRPGLQAARVDDLADMPRSFDVDYEIELYDVKGERFLPWGLLPAGSQCAESAPP